MADTGTTNKVMELLAQLAAAEAKQEAMQTAFNATLAAAEARCAEAEAQKNAALQRAWSAEASLSVRVGMRREFEEILGVSDTMEPGAFGAGMRRLRALVAAGAEVERLRGALRENADAACANRITIRGRLSECDDVSGNPEDWCVVCRSRRALAQGGGE